MDPLARLLRIAAAAGLTGVEPGTSYGTPSIKRSGKFLARLKDEHTLAIRCPLQEKEVLLEAEPEFYFQTDHYVGHPAILVRLDKIDDTRLQARLQTAWAMKGKR